MIGPGPDKKTDWERCTSCKIMAITLRMVVLMSSIKSRIVFRKWIIMKFFALLCNLARWCWWWQLRFTKRTSNHLRWSWIASIWAEFGWATVCGQCHMHLSDVCQRLFASHPGWSSWLMCNFWQIHPAPVAIMMTGVVADGLEDLDQRLFLLRISHKFSPNAHYLYILS